MGFSEADIYALIDGRAARKGKPPTFDAATGTLTEAHAGTLEGVVVVTETAARTIPTVTLPAPSAALAQKSVVIVNRTNQNDGTVSVEVEGGVAFACASGDDSGSTALVLGDTLGALCYCDGAKWHGFRLIPGFPQDEPQEIPAGSAVTLSSSQVLGFGIGGGKELACTASGTTITLPAAAKGGACHVINTSAGNQTVTFTGANGPRSVTVGPDETWKFNVRKKSNGTWCWVVG